MTFIPQHYAVVGAGMAGIVCARTLVQAGHRVTVYEKSRGAAGRMASRETAFGSFDHGAQYFTVRDARFAQALQSACPPDLCRPWQHNGVRVLNPQGQIMAVRPEREPHWVSVGCMNALVRHWAEPLRASAALQLLTQVTHIEPDALDAQRWQLRTATADGGQQVQAGFNAVLLAIPSAQALDLLQKTQSAASLRVALAGVRCAPCWTLMLAYPQAMQPGLQTLGPQWHAARSTHPRLAWLARESSKPQRGPIERWTVQASPEWSQRHLEDEPQRVIDKLRKAFAQVSGIHAEPAHAVAHRWRYAQTTQALGVSHLWEPKQRIGLCGDWCLGPRVEDAFVSGLELALRCA